MCVFGVAPNAPSTVFAIFADNSTRWLTVFHGKNRSSLMWLSLCGIHSCCRYVGALLFNLNI